MNNDILSKAPFVRITFLFILGIILALNFSVSQALILNLIIGFTIFSILVVVFITRRYYYINILYGIIISSIFILTAFWFTQAKLNKVNNQKNISGILLSEVVSAKIYKNGFYKIKIKILSKTDSSVAINTNAIAFLKSDIDSFNIKIGDFILLNSEFNDVEQTKTPYQFNYKSYLKYSDISKIGFVNNTDWKLIKNKKFNIYRISENVRQFFVSRFSSFDIKPENLAIINAIVLGDKSDITPEIGKEYANAGVMHVLAVSGLHVGIFYLILAFLLKSFAGYKIGRYLRFFLIIIILWTYAFVTGLSPSVVRSVIMFSIISVSIIMQRQHNIYNTIFVSAFVLLVINPFYITKIGFQLSYLAVIGIIFFQPRISKIIKIKNKILSYLWDLIAVSIAAQISTAPIILYYFSKFPNYFIITNLFVMLLVIFVLSFGIAFLVLSFVPYLNTIIAKLLDWLLDIMGFIIHRVNTFPKAITDNINVNFIEMILLYLLLISIAYYMVNRNKKSVISLLVSVFALIFYSNFNYYTKYSKSELIMFNVKHHSYIGIIENKKSELICSTNYKKSTADINFNIKKYYVRNNCEITKVHFLDCLNPFENNNLYCDTNFIKYKTKIIFLANNNYNINEIDIKIDYLYLIKFNKKLFEHLLAKTTPKEIIISNKIPKYFEDDIIDICQKKQIKYYSLLSKPTKIIQFD